MNALLSTDQSLPAKNYSSGNTCAKCSSRMRCLPYGLDERSVAQVDRLIGKRHWVERNELLLRVGEPFHCLYIIHGGQFKTFRDNAHGKQHVMGFHMAGEILGMSAISTGIHDSNAMALEDSEVCEVPFAQLQMLCASIPALQQHFHRLLSEEINRDQRVMRFLGSSAELRFATFLLDLSSRFAARGYSRHDFTVLMSREDIGNYIGLTMESVSRLMSKFRRQGWISTDGKDLHILNYRAIEALANDQPMKAMASINSLTQQTTAILASIAKTASQA
ncbi:transcriptional regulator [Janthinobacterium sp. BJB1]|uniref:helix-turn-helix domain-containing protein n=1 Tax=Janthinobacterium sp. GW458P TaxID=1981504 RepID=UPI000A329CFD|nr:helix-turn-helix domain-containing protein [Janthinobacterium sp. GW458P]MBE3025099.1 helix-turn-helix domain-containing protein [Janthinobacterium sp. GW458P]PHV17640.1 transcriptional regulator [Janthinobacterium sp. BJB303]PJC99512.1 transcriptional regulator [Janthinobacterium sp. BJB1]